MPDYANVKLGRLQRDRLDPRDLSFLDYVDLAVVSHPTSVDNTAAMASWPLWLNDKLGCCTISSSAGETCAWCAHIGGCTILDSAVEDAYSAVSGYDPTQTQPDGSNPTDNGAVMVDVLKYRKLIGIFDSAGSAHKVGAYFAVPQAHQQAVNAGIYLADSLYVGWSLPIATQQLGTEWRLPAGQEPTGDWAKGSWGGHATVVLAYDEATGDRKTISWGEIITVGESFWEAYVEEVWAAVSPDWADPHGVAPNGFDVAQLDADLQALGAGPAAPPASAHVSLFTRFCRWIDGLFARYVVA